MLRRMTTATRITDRAAGFNLGGERTSSPTRVEGSAFGLGRSSGRVVTDIEFAMPSKPGNVASLERAAPGSVAGDDAIELTSLIPHNGCGVSVVILPVRVDGRDMRCCRSMQQKDDVLECSICVRLQRSVRRCSPHPKP